MRSSRGSSHASARVSLLVSGHCRQRLLVRIPVCSPYRPVPKCVACEQNQRCAVALTLFHELCTGRQVLKDKGRSLHAACCSDLKILWRQVLSSGVPCSTSFVSLPAAKSLFTFGMDVCSVLTDASKQREHRLQGMPLLPF